MSHGRTLGEVARFAQPLYKITCNSRRRGIRSRIPFREKNVAKKTKIEPEKVTAPALNGEGESPKSAARPSKKTRATAAKPKKKEAATKPKTPKAAVPAQSGKRPSPAHPMEPSDDAIRLRAYFLAERRAKLSLPGDSAHDWIEARRQLLEEAGR
jgi:hypothetical protein